MTPALRQLLLQGLDPDARQFAAACGITDPATKRALSAFVRTLKSVGAWADTVVIPMKSGQNLGTGSSVATLGGWTTNAVTLTNSPTWGSDGIAFNGSTQYGAMTLPGLAALTALTVFARVAPTNASAADTATQMQPWSFGNRQNNSNAAAATGSVQSFNSTALLSGETFGLLPNVAAQHDSGQSQPRIATSGLTWTAGEDFTLVLQLTTSGTSLWKNTTGITFDKTRTLDATSNITPAGLSSTATQLLIAGNTVDGSVSQFHAGKIGALVVCKASLSQSAREAITAALAAL